MPRPPRRLLRLPMRRIPPLSAASVVDGMASGSGLITIVAFVPILATRRLYTLILVVVRDHDLKPDRTMRTLRENGEVTRW